MTERIDLASLRGRLLSQPPLRSKEKLAVASVAIIINSEDRGGSVLLIRRIERVGDPWSGQIGFPGGHWSPNDEDLLQTAIREAWEEVGIRLGQRELSGFLPLVTTLSRRVQVAPVVFTLGFAPTIRMNREVADSFWVPLSELVRLESTKREVHVDEGRLEVDSYDYQGRVIWGLTYRILNLLLDRKTEGDL